MFWAAARIATSRWPRLIAALLACCLLAPPAAADNAHDAQPTYDSPALDQAPAPPADLLETLPSDAVAEPGYGDVYWVEPWDWVFLPEGLIYRSYLAGVKESRMGSVWFHDRDQDWLWDIALGGRVGMLRYGNDDCVHPQGWQLDIEGAAFPRLDSDRELVSTDFRFGIPLTYGEGPYQTKFAYYHLSSHLGDEYMLKTPNFQRLNYTRDAFVWGHSAYVTEDLRLYGEIEWAFHTDGGADPWAFQFGFDYAPARPTGFRGAPFAAMNVHLREEVDFGGHFTIETGWQWRGGRTGKLLRAGLHYLNGKSPQFEFFDDFEEQIGAGIWYDY
jgi:hypothetical protein